MCQLPWLQKFVKIVATRRHLLVVPLQMVAPLQIMRVVLPLQPQQVVVPLQMVFLIVSRKLQAPAAVCGLSTPAASRKLQAPAAVRLTNKGPLSGEGPPLGCSKVWRIECKRRRDHWMSLKTAT